MTGLNFSPRLEFGYCGGFGRRLASNVPPGRAGGTPYLHYAVSGNGVSGADAFKWARPQGATTALDVSSHTVFPKTPQKALLSGILR